MQVKVIHKRLVNLGPVILQRSEPVRRNGHFAGLNTRCLRDIGGGSKDGAAFDVNFHCGVRLNRWVERWVGIVMKILALDAVLDFHGGVRLNGWIGRWVSIVVKILALEAVLD